MMSPGKMKQSNLKERAIRDAMDALMAKNKAMEEKTNLLNDSIFQQ